MAIELPGNDIEEPLAIMGSIKGPIKAQQLRE